MSSELVKYDGAAFKTRQPMNVIKAMGRQMHTSIEMALPKFMKGQADTILRALYTECLKNPKLLDATPETLFSACIQAGSLGLKIGGVLGQCYLIPFKGTVNLIVGYKGYIQLVNRSGEVGVMHAETVWDCDEFHCELGSSPFIRHVRKEPKTLKEMEARKSTHFYATVMTKQGPIFQVMSRLEAEMHRSRFAMFKGGDGPWFAHFEAMAMKTCIIKLCKYLPMSAEAMTPISAAVEMDPEETGEITPLPITGMSEVPNDPPADAKPDDRPDEEKEPENLPEPNKPPAQQVEEKVKKAAGKKGKAGSMFGEGAPAPKEQQLPD